MKLRDEKKQLVISPPFSLLLFLPYCHLLSPFSLGFILHFFFLYFLKSTISFKFQKNIPNSLLPSSHPLPAFLTLWSHPLIASSLTTVRVRAFIRLHIFLVHQLLFLFYFYFSLLGFFFIFRSYGGGRLLTGSGSFSVVCFSDSVLIF